MKFNYLIKHLFKSRFSKSNKVPSKPYMVKSPHMSNTLIYGMTSMSLGTMELQKFLGKRKPQATQDDVDALIYFERKEGKQMLAAGYKFHDLHPAMQAALKYGKTYLKKHE